MKAKPNKRLEKCRIRTGVLRSDKSLGNNGAFQIPFNKSFTLMVVVSDTSGWDMLCPWSINTTIAITALIHAANPVVDLGMVTNAGSDSGTLVPFSVANNGTKSYVKLYTLA